MKRKAFTLPMKNSERIFGWLYLPIHMFLMVFAIKYIYGFLNSKYGVVAESGVLNLIYYLIGFVLIAVFMFRFLRLSFSDLCDNFKASVVGILIGYVAYYVLSYLVMLLLSGTLPELTNPNTATVNTEFQLNPNVMKAVGIFLGPIVEEVLFRGVVFGTIRKKTRIFAYIVSIMLFAVYHLWDYILTDFTWSTLLYLVQYIPGGLVLAWCYEHSRNIWAPIFLHMLINFVAFSLKLLI